MAKNASTTDIFPRGDDTAPLPHGGDLAAARRLFPGAPEPFIDLSTGINPKPYPLPRFSADVFTRLPGADATQALAEAAAAAYRAPSAAHVVPAPGTQILLPLVAGLVAASRAAILTPSYGEFARAAALAGHCVDEVHDPAALRDAPLAFIANPNNPDGRIIARADLLALAAHKRRAGGLLVVDEAFMDAGPADASLAPETGRGNIVVLRSFGKFFGLPGIRLGFAIAAPETAARLASLLGPWAVSGPALAAGSAALPDRAWIEASRTRLAEAAQHLDHVLTGSGLDIVGGTTLFRLARTQAAGDLFHHLGRAGILVRRFAGHAAWLRFGLPANEQARRRLQRALAAFRRGG